MNDDGKTTPEGMATTPRPAGDTSPDLSSSAVVSSPKFGGNTGGKPRKDGLPPGSPEAKEADKKRNRERKQLERARRRAENPPILPSANPPPIVPLPTMGNPTNPNPIHPAPAMALLPQPAPDPAFIPWEAKNLEPVFAQIIPPIERASVARITRRAAKANLPKPLLTEIERDARWNEPAKQSILTSGPQLAAKWLNKSGLSAEYQPEVVFLTACASIATGQSMILAKLDKLIAAQEAGNDEKKTDEHGETKLAA